MTNEEIIKRFEFDVMVGKLRSITGVLGEVICPFESDDAYELLFISKIFNSLGFSKNNKWNYPSFKDADGISINITHKTWWYYTKDIGEEDFYDNEIPDYLEEFMGKKLNEKE